MRYDTYLYWWPTENGHKPNLKTEKNVEYYDNCGSWKNVDGYSLWLDGLKYRYPAEDLVGPKTEDAFELMMDHVEDIFAGPDIVPPEPTECHYCYAPLASSPPSDYEESAGSLTGDAELRNEYPMADGLLDYFPNALAEVSRLSFVATQQHHPDQPMHWDRSKSLDHRNKIMRHLVDTGKFDDKGMRHSAMVAWRALALLQTELEEAGAPKSRASRN